jgi:RimJ/RimL family protein N-acetyltransferase
MHRAKRPGPSGGKKPPRRRVSAPVHGSNPTVSYPKDRAARAWKEVMMTDKLDIALRPIDQDDIPILNKAYSSPDWTGELQWHGFFSNADSIATAGPIDEVGGRLMIAVGQETAGTVMWYRRQWGPARSGSCWEIGLYIFPGHRLQGIGRAATAELVRTLFNTTPVHRIQAATDVLNVGGQSILKYLGFTQEGLVRSAQWRNGEWHDQILFSLLRTDLT